MGPKMKGGKNLILLSALIALLLGAQTSALASVILDLYEGPDAVPFRDGEIIDVNHHPNRVTSPGKVDHDWFMNIATGNVGPNMVVAGKDHKSGHANGLAGFVPFDSVMQFGETGSGGPSNPAQLAGWRIRGASTFNFWLYSDDTLLGMSAMPGGTSESFEFAAVSVGDTRSQTTSEKTLLGLTTSPGSTLGSFESATFSGNDTSSQATLAPLSLTSLKSPINQPADEYITSSIEKESQGKVPEPATLILYGLGFAGAGLYIHWRRSRN